MTPRRWAFTYLATAASMAALGAATAVAVVALEERAGRRLGDGEMPTGDEFIDTYYRPALVSNDFIDDTHDRRALISDDSTYTGPERRDPLAASVHCDHDCTCHGRRAGE